MSSEARFDASVPLCPIAAHSASVHCCTSVVAPAAPPPHGVNGHRRAPGRAGPCRGEAASRTVKSGGVHPSDGSGAGRAIPSRCRTRDSVSRATARDDHGDVGDPPRRTGGPWLRSQLSSPTEHAIPRAVVPAAGLAPVRPATDRWPGRTSLRRCGRSRPGAREVRRVRGSMPCRRCRQESLPREVLLLIQVAVRLLREAATPEQSDRLRPCLVGRLSGRSSPWPTQ